MGTGDEDSSSSPSPVALAFAVAALQGNHGAEMSQEVTSTSLEPHQAMTLPQTSVSGAAARPESEGLASASKKNCPEDAELDLEDKLARNRERNREHARKTRLRKKAQLEALQSRAKGLEAERQVLRQQIEECSIASILLGLSSGSERDPPHSSSHGGVLQASSQFTTEAEDSNPSKSLAFLTGGGNRKRFVLDATGEHKIPPLQLNIGGQLALIGGGKSQVNWKTGSYVDEDGKQNRLTEDQLEHLRRERNRLHAKMTRDRKKCFIATIEKTIEDLESDIGRMKGIIAEVSHTKQLQLVTPATSPELQPVRSPSSLDHDDEASVYSAADDSQRPVKRVRHGFSLGD